MRVKTLDQKWISIKTRYEKKAWLKEWFKFGISPEKLPKYLGRESHPSSGWEWIFNGLRIIKDQEVKKEDASLVELAICSLIQKLQLNLKIHSLTSDAKVDKLAEETSPTGFLNLRDFIPLLYHSSPFGTVYLTNKTLEHPDFSSDLQGYGNFNLGIVVISTKGAEKLSITTQHEITHMLGFMTHHESWKVSGYPEAKNCLMLSDASKNESLCPRCSDALFAFWKGIEQRTKKHFLLKF